MERIIITTVVALLQKYLQAFLCLNIVNISGTIDQKQLFV